MRKVLAFGMLFLFCSMMSFPALGASGIFNSFINITTAGNTWYQLGTFNGTFFGTLTPSSTLLITGAELNTFKNGGSDVTGAFLNYRIYRVGDAAPGFTEVARGFTANAPFNDALGAPFSGSGDQKWADGALNVNAISFASVAGTYRIEVFTRASSTDGDHFFSNFGNNFIATFDFEPPAGNGNGNGGGGAIPEPSTIGLSFLGLLFLRKRLQVS